MLTDLQTLPLPLCTGAEQVVAPEGSGPGHWAGAPSALREGGTVYLAYRMRRPVDQGRGGGNVVARSEDGVHFTTLWRTAKEAFGAESLERPWLTHGPDGVWRLYVSCATPGTKHWRVDLLEADDPGGFDTATARTVFPGSAAVAHKDPVIRWWNGQWHAWVCCHPLDDPEATDRMWTEHATSDDGATWAWHGRVLEPLPQRWDSRGTRVADVLPGDVTTIAFYDGRATAAENFEERTGVAAGHGTGRLELGPDVVAAESPDGGHGLRYMCVVPDATGDGCLVYYEAARADGAHDLRVERRHWKR